VLVIDDIDNVATSLIPLSAGIALSIDRRGTAHCVVLLDDIPIGHKFALDPIAEGEPVRKYGVVVARATSAISPGQHVHVHNVESNRGRGDRT
jgi:altronate dehydratase small subunit